MSPQRRQFYSSLLARSASSCKFLIWIFIVLPCNASPLNPSEEDYFKYYAGSSIYGAPFIMPTQSDITLDAGGNITLSCEANEPVVWRLPNVDPDMPVEHEISEYRINDNNRSFGSHLKLLDISAFNVGDYYCVGANHTEERDLEDLVEKYEASKIYIFVNDPNYLIVPFPHPVITGFRYSDVIIPCKPTSKDIEIELINEAHSPPLNISSNRYDPTIGFIVTIIDTADSGPYACRPKDEEAFVYIQVMINESQTKHINKPKIVSATGAHAFVGDDLVLNCTLNFEVGVTFSMDWELPNDNAAKDDGRANSVPAMKKNHPETYEMEIGETILTVKNAKETDTGEYICKVADHSGNTNSQKKIIKILNREDSYIEIQDVTKKQRIIQVSSHKKQVQMLLKYKAYPRPQIEWYNNFGKLIIPTKEDKYDIQYKEHSDAESVTLIVKHPQLQDTGEYYAKLNNGFMESQVNFTLYVTEKPSVKVQSVYLKPGEETVLTCECAGYPASKITWSYTPCKIKPIWPTCEPTRAVGTFKENTYKTVNITSLSQQSELRFKPSEPGIAKCFAVNTVGNDTAEAEVLIGDLDEPFHIYGIDANHKSAVGNEVNLTCGAVAYNYTNDINWYINDFLVEETDNIKLTENTSKYSYRKILNIKKARHQDDGVYECRVSLISLETESKYISVRVFDPQPAVINRTNLLGATMSKKLAELLRLECTFTGIPEPKIVWLKDGQTIEANDNDTHLFFNHDYTILEIPFIKPEDQGTYKCIVSNRVGRDERSATLKITNLSAGLSLGWIFGISVLILILIAFIIYLYIRNVRERKALQELKNAGLANFEQGAIECINPSLSIDEQAEYLPYDRRFEFPRDKLKLGKQLGAGAFGVVLKATAAGILPDEKETTVAVKMVKKTADNEVMRALVSELKIMVHLGKHLNVVNLLGAITKDIAKREVMVIVEYCRYGNVQNFLLKNRKRFIDQISPDTDQIDPCIVTKQQRWSTDYEYNSKDDPDRKSGRNSNQVNSKGYIRHSESDYYGENMNSCNTEQTLISTSPEGEGSIILSNNSVQPAWRSNYKPDCNEGMDINTTNLVSWAFQVARGMDYLASRKVLHGDLAARNILLCDDNIVKICDFGLARSMYKSDNYKKQGEAPLPIKWLALESLGDQVFSTNSDVWSFGIVLWEFFSLAKVPYPGMEADQTLYLKLKDGYRMEKPEYANQDIYDVMLHCWNANPESRPSFNELQRRLAKMLEDDITNHYVDLNEPYLRMNTEIYRQRQTDYLALMGCPEEVAPQAPPNTPPYVNGHLVNELKNKGDKSPTYLHMSPTKTNAQIFSPRPQDDLVLGDHFSFPPPNSPTISNNLDSPITKNRKKTGIPEEIPMLNRTHSDSETEFTPDAKSGQKKFADIDLDGECETILAGNESYVNIQPIEKKIMSKDAFSNPGYSILTSADEKRK